MGLVRVAEVRDSGDGNEGIGGGGGFVSFEVCLGEGGHGGEMASSGIANGDDGTIFGLGESFEVFDEILHVGDGIGVGVKGGESVGDGGAEEALGGVPCGFIVVHGFVASDPASAVEEDDEWGLVCGGDGGEEVVFAGADLGVVGEVLIDVHGGDSILLGKVLK